ncbi:hypothetical protein NKH93_28250 [Mesorhizobium sp. M0954]
MKAGDLLFEFDPTMTEADEERTRHPFGRRQACSYWTRGCQSGR